jgi:hypothetical protein
VGRGKKERKEYDKWDLLALQQMKRPVLEDLLVYPRLYEAFYFFN